MIRPFYIIPVSIPMAIALVGPGSPKGEGMEKKCASGYETAEVHLPKPRLTSETSIERALLKRRSVRQFRDEPLTLAEIGQLVWAAQGVTSANGFRAAPSAGALYPLELYVVASRVSGLAAGIYRYVPASHALLKVQPADRRKGLTQAAWDQTAIEMAPASLLFSAVFERTTRKYGGRGIRYVHMDLGHAAENVYLQAVALDLGTVVIGAFDDDAVAKAACLPPGEKPLAIMPVGRKISGR